MVPKAPRHYLTPHPRHQKRYTGSASEGWVTYWCGGGAHGDHGIGDTGGTVHADDVVEELSDVLGLTPRGIRTHSQYVGNLPFAYPSEALAERRVNRLVYFVPAALLAYTRTHHLLEGLTAFRQLLLLPYWHAGTSSHPREIWVLIEEAPLVHSSRYGSAVAGYAVDYALSPEVVWRELVRGPELQKAGYPLHCHIVHKNR